eukprot:TRINITY_DN5454_c0_g1_i2.p1 TRINITY_DN5454_c0_g1~~TRINITY_DN5454_c0_g1_i2.p1  ORF type:complete len:483 (+),score=53.36 TRINITY_DN5454_c0_g1_i2:31-1479(+)
MDPDSKNVELGNASGDDGASSAESLGNDCEFKFRARHILSIVIGKIDRFFTNFYTPQLVIIRSKKLRVPEVIITFGFLVAAACIFVRNLRCFDRVDVFASSIVNFRAPSTCPLVENLETHGQCREIRQRISDFPECQSLPQNVTGCKVVSLDELNSFSRSAGQGTMLALSSTEYLEEACAEESNCFWRTIGAPAATYYAVGVENIMVHLRAQFKHQDGSQNLFDTQGFLQFWNETEPRLIPNRMTRTGGHYFADFFENKYRSHVCGDGVLQKGRTCASTDDGDFYSVGLLLEAANISLQSIRTRGQGLILSIDFTDFDVDDFWSHPIGPKPKYVIRPHPFELAHGDSLGEQEIRELDANHRHVYIKPCLKILMEHLTGQHAHFSLFRIVSLMVIFGTAAKIGSGIVNSLLTKCVFRRLSTLFHVYEMHNLAKYKCTTDDATYKQNRQEGTLQQTEEGQFNHLHLEQHLFDRKVAKGGLLQGM